MLPRSQDPKKTRSGDRVAARQRVGELIVQSGIYRVHHGGHRVSHYVVLIAGQEFPRCARCGEEVEFELFRAATEEAQDTAFHVHVYEIPHPPPTPRKKVSRHKVA